MAVTITRTAWTDDDGSGTTGTVINNAVKTELYNQIDAALAALSVSALSDGTNVVLKNAANVIAAQGVHDFSTTANSYQIIRAITTSAGTAARSVFRGVAGAVTGDVSTFSDGYTTSGLNIQGSTLLSNDGAGGTTIAATHASGILRLVAGGTTTRVTVAATGALTLAAHVAGTPSWVTGDKYLVVDASGNVHVSAVGPAS